MEKLVLANLGEALFQGVPGLFGGGGTSGLFFSILDELGDGDLLAIDEELEVTMLHALVAGSVYIQGKAVGVGEVPLGVLHVKTGAVQGGVLLFGGLGLGEVSAAGRERDGRNGQNGE